jgi:hypothetical protein
MVNVCNSQLFHKNEISYLVIGIKQMGTHDKAFHNSSSGVGKQ